MSFPDFPGPLFTDLYELNMAAGYFNRGIDAQATFSLFTRSHPRRSYFVAAGLSEAVEGLARFRFTADEIDWLAQTGRFKRDFLDFLAAARFTGDVLAMEEGQIFFPNEPVLEVTGPLIQAQLVETYLINTVGVASLLATKAARCVHAAAGRPLFDFSLRRTQGSSAGMAAARSAYLAGFAGTSNVLAGKTYGIPITGTMAHAFVMAFESEIDAFQAYADIFPDSAVFLIDTYDTLQGAKNAAVVGGRMQRSGHHLLGVRLDSGEMVALSRQVRRILDGAGLPETDIYASSGFDEYAIARMIADGARIDAFGVGTHMGVSADLPYLDMVYKLVRLKDRNVRKVSAGKATLAGEKQVFRTSAADGRLQGDLIGLRDDTPRGARPLLAPVMQNGRPIRSMPPLAQVRRHFAETLARLDDRYKRLSAPQAYPVAVSARLANVQDRL
jgi:nicotinate phosphoribosyltransferase